MIMKIECSEPHCRLVQINLLFLKMVNKLDIPMYLYPEFPSLNNNPKKNFTTDLYYFGEEL